MSITFNFSGTADSSTGLNVSWNGNGLKRLRDPLDATEDSQAQATAKDARIKELEQQLNVANTTIADRDATILRQENELVDLRRRVELAERDGQLDGILREIRAAPNQPPNFTQLWFRLYDHLPRLLEMSGISPATITFKAITTRSRFETDLMVGTLVGKITDWLGLAHREHLRFLFRSRAIDYLPALQPYPGLHDHYHESYAQLQIRLYAIHSTDDVPPRSFTLHHEASYSFEQEPDIEDWLRPAEMETARKQWGLAGEGDRTASFAASILCDQSWAVYAVHAEERLVVVYAEVAGLVPALEILLTERLGDAEVRLTWTIETRPLLNGYEREESGPLAIRVLQCLFKHRRSIQLPDLLLGEIPVDGVPQEVWAGLRLSQSLQILEVGNVADGLYRYISTMPGA